MPPPNPLYPKICQDIRARLLWLSRQSVWYAMRHDGLRRRHAPWPGAADLHYPLADSIIEKLKPFYFNQLFGSETVAQLTARRPELTLFAGDAALWFDYKLKQASNLETELLLAIDRMLMAGHVPVKIYWDADRRRLAFDAIEPQHCIVPEGTQTLEDADRVTLVHHLSAEGYLRDARFPRKDAEFLQRITGRGTSEDGESPELEGTRQLREGITHAAAGENTVIVWEIWEQRQEGWWVHWLSPLAPETPLRPSQRNPFRHGRLPLVRFDCEVKDKGHYASRGIPERVGAFEAALCKNWNEKSDHMTLCNRPLFTSASPIPNAGNLRLIPGQIIPGGLAAVQMPPPPVSFDQEMNSTRTLAEQSVGTPDFGVLQRQGHRTATEVERVVSLLNIAVELRARTFRMSLSALLQTAWSTLLQYDRDTRYFAGGELHDLQEAALAPEEWLIEANGSSESWDRPAQLQRAVQRKQLFAGSPWIDQRELDRSILELDDPRLVKRLFRPEVANSTPAVAASSGA